MPITIRAPTVGIVACQRATSARLFDAAQTSTPTTTLTSSGACENDGRAGVRLQVITPAGGRAPYFADEAAAVDAAQLYNDRAAQLVGRYPDRFKSFVSLPLPHIDASLHELRRGLDELGMIGVNMHISALDRSVAEDEFLPLYEEINRRNGLIFYHPAGNCACCPMITDYGFGGAVGTSLEDTVIGLHLIAKQIPSKCPDITMSSRISAGRSPCCSTGSTTSSR